MFIAPFGRAAIVGTAVLLLSSCSLVGGDSEFADKTPRDIAKASFKEMRGVTSMRILGRTKTDRGITRIDLSLDRDGSCVGSLSFDSGGMRIIQNEEGAWFNADEKFWRSGTSSPAAAEQVLAIYRGSWVPLGEKDDFVDLCDLNALRDAFKLTKRDTADSIAKGEVEQIGETDAIALVSGDSKEQSTVWVSIEAPHRVLKMAPTDAVGESEAIYFEDFGVEVVAETPAKTDIVEVP